MTNPCPEESCVGCFACVDACPFSAITKSQNERGFYVPSVSAEKCRDCGKCVKTCPANVSPEIEDYPKRVYAFWSKDAALLRASTSGGFFSILAERILSEGGEVWGAAFDEALVLRAQRARNASELAPLRRSKYVQSDASGVYSEVRATLQSGRRALFVGTPCQCAALRNFLGRSYDNLVVMDFVCHGVPSLELFRAYLTDLSKRLGNASGIKAVNFRVKLQGWSGSGIEALFNDGQAYRAGFFTDPYLIAFTTNLALNNPCYACRYANLSRPSDITVSDYWGYMSRKWKTRDRNVGISMAMINTRRGGEIYDALVVEKGDEIVSVETPLEEAAAGNPCLSRSFPASKNRDAFWRAFLESGKDFGACAEFCRPRKKSFKSKLSVWIRSHLYLAPAPLQRLYLKLQFRRRVQRR